jgi:hypothetical protein
MFVAMAKLASKSNQDSAESATFDWFCLCRVAGFRVAEYAQKTQLKLMSINMHLGIRLLKPLLLQTGSFKMNNGILWWYTPLMAYQIHQRKMKLALRIQKNHQNGQSITFVANDKHQNIWPVRASYRIYLQGKRLGQSDDQPMGVFVSHHGLVKYLTANKIADVLQSIAREYHPDLTRDELMCSLLTQDEYGLLFCLMRLEWILISSSLDFVGWVTHEGFACKTLSPPNQAYYCSWIIF